MSRSILNFKNVSKLLQDISKGKVELDVCDLTQEPILRNAVKIEKDTASPTDVVFGTLVSDPRRSPQQTSSLPVAIKLFKLDDEDGILGLQYEAKLYRTILEKIIVKKYSPNFNPFIGYAECKHSALQLKNIPSVNVGLLVTERIGSGARFGQVEKPIYPTVTSNLFFSDERIDDEDKRKVYFQLVFSIAVLQRFGIVHNDLHAGNVLVTSFDRPITLQYEFNRTFYKIETEYVLTIYDWDLAYCKALGDNLGIRGWRTDERVAMNSFNQKRDLYTFFCSLYFDSTDIGERFYLSNSQTRHREDEAKRKQYSVSLTEEQFKKFSEKGILPEFVNANTAIYNIGKAQLEEVICDFLPGIKDVFRTYGEEDEEITFSVSEKKGLFVVSLYSPFRCRLPNQGKGLPSPDDILHSDYFNSLKIPKTKLKKGTVVYRCPKSQKI